MNFQSIRALAGAPGIINLSGISESRVTPVAAELASARTGQSLIVTSSYGKAKRLAEDLSFFISKNIYVMPEGEQAFLRYDAKSTAGLAERITAMTALAKGEDCVVVTPVTGAVKRLTPPRDFEAYAMTLSVGCEAELELIKGDLVRMGYDRAPTVEAKGQFCVRGGILDVYPMDAELPVRIEFFDTELDSIRTFDADTQRSLKPMREISIYPAQLLVQCGDLFEQGEKRLAKAYDAQLARLKDGEEKENLRQRRGQLLEYVETATNLQFLENYIPYFYQETAFIWDYLGKNGLIMLDDPDRLYEALGVYEREGKEDFTVLLERGRVAAADSELLCGKKDFQHVLAQGQTKSLFVFTPFQKQIRGIDRLDKSLSVVSRQTPAFNGRMDFLETELSRYAKQGYEIIIACSTEERAVNMKEFVSRAGLDTKVRLRKGSLSSGMDYPEEKLLILSDNDIFMHTKQKRKHKESKNAKPIKAFTDIKKGDYVVHENHGVGKFLGVEQLEIQGSKKDYLKVKYAGEDMLYVPVDQMDMIQKYVGSDGTTPRINKLSSGEWKKTKARAKAAIAVMAQELIELSAARQLEKGYAFSPDTPWQKEFEEMFPYEETPDQLRCIKEIKADMEKTLPMDRLLCGDVGYGKTEVAARAIFKCIADGKQAAVLVPTTILANQHYHTFKNRFEHFPFKVEMLCRFRSESQQDEIITEIGKGNIDVIVGTHRMLSKDVHFKDLGLLVIDEEQRFGVQHKEAIKMLRKNVDVLTLSATPIPRTLHMSLIGIKEMSLIEEPPEERYPVQTYVMEQDDDVIREAVQRELDRGGQVYVVYNRVKGIQKIAALIRELVPDARVGVGHGQMNERQLEDIMLDFVNGEFNVLVATTIIESGIDIPNANTILIVDADRYGLSQLYQLRGRVGRSNRMSYAYLMYQRDKVLAEAAEKRLRSIREFTEFGAGFRIAMRDLEIRGAGNLLGMEQSGHMMMIGYELYCKLVDEAVRELSGNPELRPEVETEILLDLPAFIPDYYISDELLKLQMYKKIAAIRDDEEREEIIDELVDRFGDVPSETINLIDIALIKAQAGAKGISRIQREQKKLVFEFDRTSDMTPEKIGPLLQAYGMRVTVYGGTKPSIKYLGDLKKQTDEIRRFLAKMG
ncbi:transcription-repair coupling factor [Bacilliculturomica massiliensis]|uniref:transcription-repair coupling factor n=1 Tax=Bacilliculturomica massiliensis TaxID=1917867 RepID=UPI0010320BCD|nr:transcription-repair coupling factor [Bacilliculturomica massiliensis]